MTSSPARATWPTAVLTVAESYICFVLFSWYRFIDSKPDVTGLHVYGSLSKAVQGVPHPIVPSCHLGGCFCFLFFIRITPDYMKSLKLIIDQFEVIPISEDADVQEQASKQVALARNITGRPWLDIDERLRPNPLWKKMTSFWGTFLVFAPCPLHGMLLYGCTLTLHGMCVCVIDVDRMMLPLEALTEPEAHPSKRQCLSTSTPSLNGTSDSAEEE